MDLDAEGNLYIANSKGLLKMSGSSISLFELPGKNIIRSVAVIDGRIYTGSFREFGYWEPDRTGSLKYHSLVTLLENASLENDEFWKIKFHEGNIYFQSFGKLLCYDRTRVKSIPLPGSILLLLDCNERLFFQEIGGGLFEVADGNLLFVEGSENFHDTEIKAILPYNDNQLIVGTSSEGLFLYDGKSFSPWVNEAANDLKEFKINNGISIGNKMIFGTIMRGIIIINREGKKQCHLHTNTSLQNNTVLAVKADTDNNLWAGLDKGFDYISFNTPLKTYTGTEESFGSVYTACLHEDSLYVGTNQGIYYFLKDAEGNFTKSNFLPQSQGQVWFISRFDGNLYCGLNDGTYLIKNNKLFQVSSVSGGYNLINVTNNGKEILLQSTYNELVVYEKNDDIWQQSHTISGFGAPARFLEVDHTGKIWLGHTVTGIYQAQPSNEFDSLISVKQLDEKIGLPHLANMNRVFKVDSRIIITTGEELLQWDAVKNRLVPYTELSSQLEGFEKSTMIRNAGVNKYWFIRDNEMAMFEIRFEKARLLYRIIPEMYGLELVEDYENIVVLNDSLHLIALENGFSVLNLNRLNRLPPITGPPRINEIILSKSLNKEIRFNPSNTSRKQSGHSFNNLHLVFSAPGPVGKKKYFQYKLSNIDEEWSKWSTETTASYNRLPPGNYAFYLRTITNQGLATESAQVSLRIRPPWYLSIYAFLLYIILIAGLVWLLRLNYLRRNWKNREEQMHIEQERIMLLKEQAESEVIRLTNEKLQSEISMKNSQLANNTMSLIRKNELMAEIQQELIKQREELGPRLPKKYFQRINTLIENSYRSDQDWEIFEKLFDQAHENFFQRLKSDFPDLTPSDLRLSAYLRLNLTSKEIAPLLNITVRGVEERRYRLRKRLQLSSEQNLTEFILSY